MSFVVDEAVEAMRRANPVPDPMSLGDDLDRTGVFPTHTRETQRIMDTKQQTATEPTDNHPHRQRNLGILAAAFAVVIVVGGIVALVNSQDQTSASSQGNEAETVILLHEEYRSVGDVDALIALYAEDAVVLNHPLDLDDTARGVKEIRVWEQQGSKILGTNGSMEYRNLKTTGNIVVFDQKFVNDGGTCFSDVGIKVTVINGKITLWEWPSDTGDHGDTCS
jgi:ketosteroid isomerase-like protein